MVQAPGNVEALEEAPGLRVVGKGGGVRGDGLLQPAPLLRREVRAQGPGQVFRDPRLDAEPGRDGGVVGIAPRHRPVVGPHELHHETHPVPRPLHAAVHHQGRAHALRDVAGRFRGVLLGEGGRARQHGDAGDLGQRGREHVRHPGPDVRRTFTVAAQRKHRDHLRAHGIGHRRRATRDTTRTRPRGAPASPATTARHGAAAGPRRNQPPGQHVVGRRVGASARDALQGVPQLGRGRVAVFRLAGHRTRDHRVEIGGHVGAKVAHPRHRGAEHVHRDGAGVGADVRTLPGEQLEQRHPEAVHVAALVEGVAEQQLGRHVVRGADHHAGAVVRRRRTAGPWTR